MAEEPQGEPKDSKQHAWQKFRGKFSRVEESLSSLPFRRHHQPAGDEVEDFLRPSSASPTDQIHSLPLLNTTSSKPAWATRPEDLQEGRWTPLKPPRCQGLRVGFVTSDAEVIGIGGEASEEMTIAVSQRIRQRSMSGSRVRGASASTPLENRIARRPVSKDGPENNAPVRRAPPGHTQGAVVPSLRSDIYGSDAAHRNFEASPNRTPDARVDQMYRDPVSQSNNHYESQRGRGSNTLNHPTRNQAEYPPSSAVVPQAQPVHPSKSDDSNRHSLESYSSRQARSRSGSDSRALLHPEDRSPQRHPIKKVDQRSPEPWPSRGLRRMRAEEGLAHRNSMSGGIRLPRTSDDSADDADAIEPTSVSSASRRRAVANSRTPSRQSEYSPSPEPIAPSMLRAQVDVENHHSLSPADVTGSEGRRRVQQTETSNQGRRRVHQTEISNLDHSPRPISNRPNSGSARGTEGDTFGRQPHQPILTHQEGGSTHEQLSWNREQSKHTQGEIFPTETRSSAALDEFVASTSASKAIFALNAHSSGFDTTLYDWTRCALWWFLSGRSGIEQFARAVSERHLSRSPDRRNDDPVIVKQHFLSLSKSWWIISDMLPRRLAELDIHSKRQDSASQWEAVQGTMNALQDAFRSLTLSMKKRNLMPQPNDSLVQGQTTSLWLPAPFSSYASDWMWVLNGKVFMAPDQVVETEPLSIVPLGDSASNICYGRIFARASISIGDSAPTHEGFDCVLTALRDRNSPELKVAIASQSTAVNVMIQAPGEHGVHWEHTRFDRDATTLRVKLPQKLRLHVACHPRDFEWLSKCYDESRRVTRALRPARDERLLGSFDLISFQYKDSANEDHFPNERQDICRAAIFESFLMPQTGRNRMVHGGYRIAVTTSQKSMRSLNIRLANGEAPFEFNAPTADPSLRFQIIQPDRGRSAHLTFQGFQERDQFCDFVTGTIVSDSESVKQNLNLNSVSVSSLPEGDSAVQSTSLDWTFVSVIDDNDHNHAQEDASSPEAMSALRTLMYNNCGSYVDRIPDASSDLRIRLEAERFTSIQIMRPSHREDVTVAIGPDPAQRSALFQAFESITSGPSVMDLSLVSHTDLHTFQQAITGYKVLYDGIASTVSISRRRTGLPLSKNWEATKVRIQIVNRDRIYQLLAFFTDYLLADCLNLEVKRTDTFEKVDNKTSGHCVKMVDAKFVLPGSNTDDWLKEGAHRDASARFTSLAASEYAAEHEDILVAFPSEEDRDRFAEALPAPVTVGRKFTLKRRI